MYRVRSEPKQRSCVQAMGMRMQSDWRCSRIHVHVQGAEQSFVDAERLALNIYACAEQKDLR